MRQHTGCNRGVGFQIQCLFRHGPDLILQVAPFLIRPAIGARDPCRRTGVDPTVEHLVAFPELLPFELLKGEQAG